jgi:hypothetical protein
MTLTTAPVFQLGLPEFVPDLVGLAGTLVLVLMLVAIGGTVYKHLTGGIEWPEDRDPDEDGVRRSHEDDDEWEFY